MRPQLLLVSAPLVGLAVFIVVHVMLSHACSGRRQLLLLALSFLPGVAGTLWVGAGGLPQVELADALGLHTVNLASYAGLSFGYFTFVNLNLASLRIRVLKELDAASGNHLEVRALMGGYDSQAVLQTRLDRLVAGGQLVFSGGRYYSGKPGFLILARIINGFRLVIFGADARPVGCPNLPKT